MILYHFRKLATVLLINLQTMFDCFPATLKLFYHNAVIATISSDFRYKSLKIERVFYLTNGVPGSWMAFPLNCLACVEAWHWDRGSQLERRGESAGDSATQRYTGQAASEPGPGRGSPSGIWRTVRPHNPRGQELALPCPALPAGQNGCGKRKSLMPSLLYINLVLYRII